MTSACAATPRWPDSTASSRSAPARSPRTYPGRDPGRRGSPAGRHPVQRHPVGPVGRAPGQPHRGRRGGRGGLVPPGRTAHLRRPATARRRPALQLRQHRRPGDRRARRGRPRLDDLHPRPGRPAGPLRPRDLRRRRHRHRHPPAAARSGLPTPQRQLPGPQPGGADLPRLRGPGVPAGALRGPDRAPATGGRGDRVHPRRRGRPPAQPPRRHRSPGPAGFPTVQPEDRRHRHR